MTIELEKKEFQINNNLRDYHSQNIIEGDIIVPDTKPDIISIVNTKAEVKINNKEIHKDAMVIRGVVNFKILYISDDPSRYVCNISNDVNFDQTVDIKADVSGMKNVVNINIEHVEGNILNGRKINVKAIINSGVKLVNEVEVSAVSNIFGIDDVQVLTQPLNVSKDVELEETSAILNFDSDIPIGKPAVKEILRTNAEIKDKDVKVTGGKAVVKGMIELKSLYVPDMNEGTVEFSSAQLPFSEVLDIDYLENDDLLDIKINLGDIETNVKTDEDGDARVLSYDVTLNFRPKYLQKQSLEVVSDAYSIFSKLQIEKSAVKFIKCQDSIKAQSNIKDLVSIASEMPAIKQIYNIDYNPIVTNVNIEDDKIAIDGILELSTIYFTDNEEQPIYNYIHEIPFHSIADTKGIDSKAGTDVSIDIDNFSYDAVSQKDFEIKGILVANISLYNEENCTIISKIDELPLDEKIKKNQPSMTVYYVQDGDTLWNIAKKYFITTKDLADINSINNPELLQIGQQLLISKVN